jgi:N-acetylglucosaminylphosphatidylinositol deacetylase
LIVIAHPDDEAMFFVPTIKYLRKYNNISLLCLSNGNATGLGRIREKEL